MEPGPQPCKLTVITVVFNAAELLEPTIASVRKTDFPQVEYIVIDGGSVDGTLDVIQDNADKIDTWVSDRDKGLYDAMNKGLNMANGQFVWFVNAGDIISSADIIQKILAAINDDTDIIYGEVMIIDAEGKELGTRSELTTQKLPEGLNWKSFRYGMRVSHQGFILRKSIAPQYELNNLSADIEWCIRCLQKSRKNVLVPGIFVHYLKGGISKKKWKKSIMDRYKILAKYYGFFPNLCAHIGIMTRAVFHKILRINKISY